MMDILMLGLGFGFFALAIGYTYACERLLRERTMIFDYALAGTVSFGLLIYLTYALLRPERF
ncbi:K+-transporting ATPase KdpF subunit [Bradyrhizobium sp. LB9.1b]